MKKILQYGSFVTIFSACIFVCWTFWSMIGPIRTIDMQQPLRVMNASKQVHRGEPVLVEFNFCKYRKLESHFSVVIENDRLITVMPPETTELPIGCHNIVKKFSIPATLAIETTSAKTSGQARLRITVTYQINALRTASYTWITEDFTILP